MATPPRQRSAFLVNDLGILSPPHTGSSLPSILPARPSGPKAWAAEGAGTHHGYYAGEVIDWPTEYQRDRARLRSLKQSRPRQNAQSSRNSGSAMGGWLGSWIGAVIRLLDASQVWIVLVLTGLSTGLVSAMIDIAGGWLADLKTGVCSDVSAGGQFYLSKGFCCWGYASWDQCSDWRVWSGLTGWIIFVIASVTFATTASWLVKRYDERAQGSGIGPVRGVCGGMVADVGSGMTVLIKSIGLCLSFASGLWLGKEGPLVHVACCWAELFLRFAPGLRKNEARRREILSAAGAAGFSAAFGSPIGGVLFSLEQLASYFPDRTMWQAFVAAMVSAVTLQFVNPFRTGKLVLYQVVYSRGWIGFEIIPFAIIGLVGGVHGGLFVRLYKTVSRVRKRLPIAGYPVFEVFLLAAVTAVVSYPIPFMRAQSTELLYILFADCADLKDDWLGLCQSGNTDTGVLLLLLLTAAFGFVLAAVTFGALIPAGILLPSMAIGALYGRAIGMLVAAVESGFPTWFVFMGCEAGCVRPGTYAIVGAASALAGTTRMVVAVAVVMFELTGALNFSLPIMVAAVLARWVSDGMTGGDGPEEERMRQTGWEVLDREDRSGVVETTSLIDTMTSKSRLVVIPDLIRIGHLRALISSCPYAVFPVVKHTVLVGHVSRKDLYSVLPLDEDDRFASFSLGLDKQSDPSSTSPTRHGPINNDMEPLDISGLVDRTALTIPPSAPMHLVVALFCRLGMRVIVITDRGELCGMITRGDIWRLLNGKTKAMPSRRSTTTPRQHVRNQDEEMTVL